MSKCTCYFDGENVSRPVYPKACPVHPLHGTKAPKECICDGSYVRPEDNPCQVHGKKTPPSKAPLREQIERHIKNWVLENEVMPSSSEISFLADEMKAHADSQVREALERVKHPDYSKMNYSNEGQAIEQAADQVLEELEEK